MTALKIYKPLLLASVLLSASTAAVAQNSPGYDVAAADGARARQETHGVLTGLVVGAVLGGPPGAILSAAAGALIGNNISATQEKQQLRASLDDTTRELLALRGEQRRLQVALEQARDARLVPASFNAARAEAVNCCADSAVALHFRTNSSAIEPHYQAQLRELVALARGMPDVIVQVTGHADRRGASAANQSLSEQRVQSVARALQALGLELTALQVGAYGENQPVSAGQSPESHFYDRRVEVRLRTPNNDYLTQAGE